ncbi:MAG: hypothetical protein R3E39_20895 [Anaerolineae bacterium]
MPNRGSVAELPPGWSRWLGSAMFTLRGEDEAPDDAVGGLEFIPPRPPPHISQIR